MKAATNRENVGRWELEDGSFYLTIKTKANLFRKSMQKNTLGKV
ncbi:hypothetical protein [Chryseobacterium rhizosphaerae]|nr:hypothetical protein [Chryseobacterium rhizosphaerae]